MLDGERAGELVAALAGEDGDARALARQRAFDEQHLAIGLSRDAAALGVERVDLERQFFQSARNSCQCGRFWRTRKARKSSSSRSYCSRESAQRISWNLR